MKIAALREGSAKLIFLWAAAHAHVGLSYSMKTVLIICSNLVAVAIVAYAIISLEAQEFSLRLIMPRYATLSIEGAEKVDKKILINAIDSLNNQYEYTEDLYKKALNARNSIIYILIVTLVSEVVILSTILIILDRKTRVRGKPSTQPGSGADGV